MDNETFETRINAVCTPLPGDEPKEVKYKLSIKSKFDNYNIVNFFCEKIPRSTPITWINKIKEGNLKVNNQTIDVNYVVKSGDIASHFSEPKTEPLINKDIKLIYADDDLWIINKPSPLPMHASGRFVRNTLINILELAFPEHEFKMVHRIDANTTGLVVIAKNKTSANLLRQQFENKTIKKEYIALVEGCIDKSNFNISTSIDKETKAGGSRQISDFGKVSNTEIEIIEKRDNQSLLRVKPITGRTNQIRLHLAELGHPIVGDFGYKNPIYFENNPFTYPEDTLYLHANKMAFIHPTTLKEVFFEAPIPKKFLSV